jgi:hypothetical protein
MEVIANACTIVTHCHLDITMIGADTSRGDGVGDDT